MNGGFMEKKWGKVVIDDFKVLELNIFIKVACGVEILKESLRDLEKIMIKMRHNRGLELMEEASGEPDPGVECHEL
ncbi:hypothetical protein ACLOJK_040392 [Asimina triloba]